MSKNKKHHYLSKFYLKWFQTNVCINWNNSTWVYFWDIKRNSNSLLTEKDNFRKLEKIWYEKYLFSEEKVEWEENIIDNRLEKEFSRIESKLSPLLDNIRGWYYNFMKCNDDKYFYKFNQEDKVLLLDLLKFQRIRSLKVHPAHRDSLESEYENIIYNIEKDKEFYGEEEIEKIKWDDNKRRIIKKASNYAILNIMWPESYKLLLKKNWYIFYITYNDRSFITSDFPIYRHNDIWPDWIRNPNTQIIFPLSSKLCLVIFWEWNEFKYKQENSREFIKRVNWMVLWNVRNVVICNNLSLLKKMVKWKLKWNKYLYPENNHFWIYQK